MKIEYRNLLVALLGAGSVGSQVARLLLEQGDELAARVGAGLELVGVAVRDVDAPRDFDIPRELLTTDAHPLIRSADIVIELMGGLEPAREYIHLAIASGADVVTGNKALLATYGPELFAAADQVGAQLYYEAAAGGAIPIIRPLRDSLASNYNYLGRPAVVAVGGGEARVLIHRETEQDLLARDAAFRREAGTDATTRGDER